MGETDREGAGEQAVDKVQEQLYKILVIGDFGVGITLRVFARAQ